MSVDLNDERPPGARGESPLRPALVEVRDRRRTTAAIDDFFLPDAERLDDRTRAALSAALRRAVGVIEDALVAEAGRLLGERALADALAARSGDACARLAEAGLLRDRGLMAELVTCVRQELIAAELRPIEPGTERGALLTRLAECPEPDVATAASRLRELDNARRAAPGRVDLSFVPYRRLVWWIAAALRETLGDDGGHALDRALAEAASRALGAHDEDRRPDQAAQRLANAIDARPEELGELLVEALGDGQLALFVAIAARAAGVEPGVMRLLALDPDGSRLWLALRGCGLDAAALARVGWILCEADPRRDADVLADELDRVRGIAAADAASALDPLRLHADFRAALRALAGA